MDSRQFLELLRGLLSDPTSDDTFVVLYDLVQLSHSRDVTAYTEQFVGAQRHRGWTLDPAQLECLADLLLALALGENEGPPGWALTLLADLGDSRAVRPLTQRLQGLSPGLSTTPETIQPLLRYLAKFTRDEARSDAVAGLEFAAGSADLDAESRAYAAAKLGNLQL